jgi:cation diffusion facilitator family transporter
VVFILTYSVIDVLRGVDGPPHLIALPVAAVTMATNQFLARRGFCAAARTESPVLRTSAEHNRADAISSLATMVGVGGAALGLHRLDPIVAIFETVHIVWLSGSLFGHSLRGLMDAALPDAAVAAVRRSCSDVPGVLGVASLRTRQSGANSWVDIEVQVARGTQVRQASEIRRNVQSAIRVALPGSVFSQVKFRVIDPQSAAAPAAAGGYVG